MSSANAAAGTLKGPTRTPSATFAAGGGLASTFLRGLLLASGILAVVAAPGAHAQITFTGAPVVLGSGFNTPFGLAVDAAGDLFVADNGNGALKEIVAVNGAIPANATILTLSSGFGSITGVAVDAAGDVFAIDTTLEVVEELVAVNGSIPANPTIRSLGSGFNLPVGVALDAAGDVFVADQGNNQVKEIVAVNGTIPANPTILVLGTGFELPQGVAVDTAGDVFVADEGNNKIKEIPASCISGANDASCVLTLGSGFNGPTQVVVDAAGDLFLADQGNSAVKEIVAVNGSIPANPTILTLGGGFSYPSGVALAPNGDVYVGDSNNNEVKEIELRAVSFGGINVCPTGGAAPAPCSETLTLNFTVPAGIVGTPTVTTDGVANLDFTLGAGSACGGPAGTSCSVNVTFTPSASGLRKGAATVTVAGTSATVLLSGMGLAPQVALLPAVQSVIQPANAQEITGVAIDQGGNVYYVDNQQSAASMILNGVPTALPFTGLSAPEQVAVDGAGSVYVLGGYTVPGAGLSLAVEKLDTLGNQTTSLNLSQEFLELFSFAVDSRGSIYVSGLNGNGAGQVLRFDTNGTITPIGAGFTQPQGLAVGPDGTVYVTDVNPNGSNVYAIDQAGNQRAIGAGFLTPSSIAVDAGGAVYVLDNASDTIVTVDSAGVQKAIETLPNSGHDLKLDSNGNMYVALTTLPQTAQGDIVKYDRTQGRVEYGNVLVGTTSAPMSATVSNIGNEPLTIGGGPVSSPPYFISAPSTTPPGECGATLAGGATCLVSAEFVPPATGEVTYNYPLLDNSLNVTPSLQTSHGILFDGTGFVPPTPVAMSLTGPANPPVYGGSLGVYTVTEMDVTGAPAAGDNDIVNFVVTGPEQFNYLSTTLVNGVGTLTLTLNEPGTYTMVATDPSNGLTATDSNFTISSTGPGLNFATIGLTLNPTTPYYFDNSILNVTVTGGQIPPTGTIMYSVDNGAPQTATLNVSASESGPTNVSVPLGQLAVGAHSVSVTYSGGTSFPYLPSGPEVLNFTVADPPLSLVSSDAGANFNLGSSQGVAVDQSGNVYVADSANGDVVNVLTGAVLPLTGLISPTALTFDPSGNLYIADSGNNSVVEYEPAFQQQFTLGFNGLGTPGKIAVDSQHNVYVADPSNNQVVYLNADSFQNTVAATGLNGPQGVAVDTLGNLYIADTGNNRVVKIDTSQNQTTIFTEPPSSLYSPIAVATDAAGNVYIANGNSDFAGGVVRIDSLGHQVTLTYANGGTLHSVDVASDGVGNLYVPSGTSFLGEISTAAGVTVPFGAPVGAAGATGNASYLVPSALGTAPTAFATDLEGDAEFAVTPGSVSCAAGIASSGTCNYQTTFTPTLPGQRTGSLTLSGANGPLLTSDFYATGYAPLADFEPNSYETLAGTGLTTPGPIAVDSAGNTYVADAGAGSVFKVPVGGGTPVAILTGLVAPSGVVVDGIGNVYAIDSQNTFVKKIDPSGNITNLVNDLSQPSAIAVDGAGNLYVAENASGAGEVVKIDPLGNETPYVQDLGFFPSSLALDAVGNLYVLGDGAILKVTPFKSISPVTFNDANIGGALAVDAAGEIYAVDPAAGVIVRQDAAGNLTHPGGSIGLAIGGIALDGNGNIYFTSSNPGSVSEILRGSDGINYENVAVGSTSTTYTFTATNVGNQPLVFSGLTVPAPFVLEPPAGGLTACSGTLTLTAGTDCTLPIAFAPTAAGALAETAILTNNSLNQVGGTEGVILDGTGTGAVLTPTTLTLTASPGSSVVGGLVTLTATLGAATSTANATGTVTFYLNGEMLTTGGLVNGVATATTTALPIGSDALTASYPGDADFAASQSGTLNYTVYAVATRATTSLAVSANTVASGTPVTLTATVVSAIVGGPNGPEPISPGTVEFCDATAALCENSALLGTAQLTAAGTATLTLVPGIGVHNYKAVFAGTHSNGTSSSGVQVVTVTGLLPTVTTIATSGTVGDYTLSATIVGNLSTAIGATGPSGTVSFVDTSDGNAVAATAVLGAGTVAQTFAAPAAYATGGGEPNFVSVGDFNGDGLPDAAVVNGSSNNVSVLLGKTGGGFQTAVPYAVGGFPRSVAVGDFNGDGSLDLAVASEDGGVSVLLGVGDGTFQTQVPYTAGAQPWGIAVGDFNGDGIPDLAVTNYSDGDGGESVSILLGVGDGTFHTQFAYPVGSNPQAVGVGDFNGDGFVDLAVANAGDGTVSVLLGNGDGTFNAQTTYPVGGGPAAVAVGDFNGDGAPDLAVDNSDSGGISVLLNKHDGTGSFLPQVPYAPGGSSLALGDFNGDGTVDLATADEGGVEVLAGNGDGTFQTGVLYAINTGFTAVAVGDFNGDGVADLAAATYHPQAQNNNTVAILLNQLTETATATTTGAVSIPGAGTQNVEASYPGDALYGASVSATTPLTGSGIGTSLTLTASPVGSSFVGQPVTLTAILAPFNSNGVGTDGETITFKNNGATLGTGTLTGGVATYTTSALPVSADSLTAVYGGDTNFAAATSNTLGYSVLQPTTTEVTLAVTAAGAAATTVASGTVVTLTASVTISGDFVSPGLVKFCDATAALCENSALLGTAQLTEAGTATLKFVPGIGVHSYSAVFAGTYGEATSTSAAQALTVTGLYPTTTTIAATGAPGNYTLTGTVQAFAPLAPSGNVTFTDTTTNATVGTATLAPAGLVKGFATAATFAVGASPLGVAIGDFNADGIPDVVVCNSSTVASGNTVGILLGTGNGAFNAQVTYPEGSAYCNYLTVADVNGDGKLDVIVSNGGLIGPPGHFGVLLGNGDGTFQTALVSESGGSGGSGIITGDFNGDGIVDVVITNRWSNQLNVFLGNGDGTFQAGETLPVGSNPAVSAAAGDFNGDGILDLVVANDADNTVSVLLGNGDGSFQTQQAIATGTGPGSITIADFNNDGKLDLAVSDSGQAAVSILLGNGDGTFEAHQEYSVGSAPGGLGAADLNGDGNVDLAVANSSSNTVSVLLGNGDGTFETQQVSPVGAGSLLLAIADLNGDGVPDVVDSDGSANTVSVLLGDLTIDVTLTDVSVSGTGTQNVEASYPGDANFAASVSVTTPLIGSAVLSLAFSTPPPAYVYSGSAVGSVTVSEANAVSASNITLTVTGPNEYSQVYGPTATVAGQVSFNTSGNALNVPGTYTYSATSSDGATPAVATETVVAQSNPVPSQPVGTPAAAQGVTLVFNQQATLNSAANAIQVVTQGVPNLDFTLAPTQGAGACVAGTTYNVGQSCTEAVVFTPTAPGLRLGAVLLNGTTPGNPDNANPIVATAFLSGVGQGPLLEFNGPSPTTLVGVPTVVAPEGIAVDAAGNVFVADSPNQVVLEIPAGGGTPFQLDFSDALSFPVAVAVDGVGDVYVVDQEDGASSVFELAAGVGFSTSIYGSEDTLSGIAVDGAGNVYVSDQSANSIVEIPVGGNSVTLVAPAAGLNAPEGLAMDAAGDLFIADSGNKRVVELAAGATALTPIATGLTQSPNAVAVDAAGDLYIAESQGNLVVETNPAGVAVATYTSEIGAPLGVALDGLGNIYVASPNTQSVVEFQRNLSSSIGLGIVFDPQAAGTVSAPNVLQGLQNVGNEPLVFSSISAGTGFLVDSGTTTCSTTTSLAAAGICNIGTDFSPPANAAAGTVLTAFLSLADNAPDSPQLVSLSGTASAPAVAAQTITLVPVANQVYGAAAIAITATASSGLPVTVGVQSGPATIANNVVTITGVGTVVLVATQAGNANYSAATPVTTSFAVTPATLTVTATSVTSVFGQPLPTLTDTITGFVYNDTAASSVTGAPVLTTTATTSSAPGKYPITVAVGTLAAANYSFAFVPGTLTITQATQTIAFTPIATQTYGAAAFAATATATSGLPVTISVQSGPATVANNQVTITGVGTVVLAGNQGGNADYAAAATATTSFAVVPASTSVALSVTSNVVRTPGTISLSATVSSSATGESGTVSFLDGTTVLGTSPLSASDTAALNGVTLAVGSHNLSASYAGATDFAASTSAVQNVVVEPLAVVLNTISPTVAEAGSSDTTITATGAEFSPTAVVEFNGTPLVTTFVSATQVTAVIPAAQLATAGSINVTVTDTYSSSTSAPQTFTILPVTAVTFSGPPSTPPGEQPTLTFQLQQPYVTALNGTMTLTFTPDPGNPDDPEVQFATGGRTFNFVLPPNTTQTPLILLQAGTISGTITVSLQLTASGINVTPPNLAPITIVVPKVAPTVSAVTFSTSGDTLTVVVTGYSSTREIQSATFSFTAATGASLAEKSLTVPASTLFETWYTTAESAQYGSAFTYTQLFTLSGPATAVGSVGVTLTNTIGTSTEVSSQ